MAKVKKQQSPKSAGITCVVIAIFAFLIGIALLAAKKDVVINGPKDMNQVLASGNIKEGDFVKINVDRTFGSYAERKHTINGIIPFGKDTYYVVWLNDDSIISLSVKNKKQVKKLETIVNQTASYLYGYGNLNESITLVGEVKALKSDESKLYRDAIRMLGSEGIDFENRDIHYYNIDCTSNRKTAILYPVVFIIIGIFCIFCAVINFKYAGQQPTYTASEASSVLNNMTAGNYMNASQNYYNDNESDNNVNAQNSFNGADLNNNYYNNSDNNMQ